MKGFIEVHEIEFYGEVRKRLLNVMFISNVEKHDTANVEITGFGNRNSTDGTYHITVQEEYEDVIARIKEAKDEVSPLVETLKELENWVKSNEEWAQGRYDAKPNVCQDYLMYKEIYKHVRNKIIEIRRREQKK